MVQMYRFWAIKALLPLSALRILNSPSALATLGKNLGAWPEKRQEHHVSKNGGVFSDAFSTRLRQSLDFVPRSNLGRLVTKITFFLNFMVILLV